MDNVINFAEYKKKNKELISSIREAEGFYHSQKDNKLKITLRMSLCELI